jgi:hypothetical protein
MSSGKPPLTTFRTTPNAGVGGNASLESAAALASSIKQLVDSSPARPSFEAVEKCLKQYQKSRYQRMSEILKVSNGVTRLQALKGFMERFTVFSIFPNAGDLLNDMMADMFIGAKMIDYLPPPERSFKGTMPFNPEQGTAKKESILYRILLTLPFFGLSALALHFMSPDGLMDDFGRMLTDGQITWDGHSFTLPEKFYHFKWLDSTFKPMTILFASSSFGIDPVAWWQMLSFITDLGVLFSILLIESTRRSNVLTMAQL